MNHGLLLIESLKNSEILQTEWYALFIYLFIWRRNIYSEELLKIIHIDQDLEYIKDVDAMSKMDTDQKESTNTVYDQRNGVRCIR